MRVITCIIYLLLSVSLALAGSTVNPNVPAQNSDLSSAVVRGNFSATYNDINNILGMYPSASAPQNPVVGQIWRKTNVSPQQVYQWSGTAWLPYSTFDVSGGRVTPAFGNSLLAWQQLLTGTGGLGTSGQCITSTGAGSVPTAQDCITSSSVNALAPLSWNSGTKTMSLNYGSDLALSGSDLVLSTIISAQTQGNGTNAPVVTIDAKGRVTALTTAQITPPFTAVTGQASLSQLPDIGDNTVLGNVSGSSTYPSALTTTQLTTLVNLASGTLSGAVPAWPNNPALFFDGTGNYAAVPFASITGSLSCGQMPALTGDVSTSAGSCATAIGAGKVLPPMLAGMSANGIYARVSASTAAPRAIMPPASGITVTNGDGVAGNPTIGLANDLAAVEGLGCTGGTYRTATDSWTCRTIGGTANEITIANGDGVSGPPVASLPSALTFTGKTVTGGTFNSPTINTPTGITKADVGLGNVDNTSDATKNAASVALTNHTINGNNNTLTVLAGSQLSGTLNASNFPAMTGDVTSVAGSVVTTISASAVHSSMLNADVFSTARTWSATQTLNNPAFTGMSDIQGALKRTSIVTPAQITSTQNNYNPSSAVCVSDTLVLSSNASQDVTGLAGGVSGCEVLLLNGGSNPIVLKDSNAGSSTNNRFQFGGDITLASGQAARLFYQAGTANKWHNTGGSGGGGGGSGTVTSVAAGNGMDFPTITNGGQVNVAFYRFFMLGGM